MAQHQQQQYAEAKCLPGTPSNKTNALYAFYHMKSVNKYINKCYARKSFDHSCSVRQKFPSPASRLLQRLMMPYHDTRDGNFCPYLMTMKDTYDLVLNWLVVLVFYSPLIHFRSFRAPSVNLATLFLGKPPRHFTSN